MSTGEDKVVATQPSPIMQRSVRGATRILGPIAVVVVTGVALVLAILFIAARSLDRQAVERSRHTAQSVMMVTARDLGRLTKDYSWWDLAIEKLIEDFDLDWAEDNVGSYMAEMFDVSSTIVVGSNDSLVARWKEGVPQPAGAWPRIEPGLAELLAAARDSPLEEPEPATGYLLVEGAVHLVAASAFTPEDVSAGGPQPSQRGVLVLTRAIDQALLDQFADDYLLTGLRLAPPEDEAPASFVLTAPDGIALRQLLWEPELPGRELLKQALLPVGGAFLVVALILWQVLRRVRSMVQQEAHLRESLARQRAINSLRSRFVSMVSHEFRTPMAMIMSSSDLLKSYGERLDEAEKRAEIETIQGEVERMRTLLDEVLAVGPSETGQFEFRPGRMDLEAFCRGLVEKMRLAVGGSPEIAFSVRGACSKAFADKHLLHYALSNLLSNAVKYSPEGGRVEVGLRCGDGVAVVKVADQGIGIPEEEHARVFQPFFRAGNAGGYPGTGLGLAIARDAVKRHGGRITFKSRARAGTVFTVTVPIAGPAARAAA